MRSIVGNTFDYLLGNKFGENQIQKHMIKVTKISWSTIKFS